MSVCEEGVCVSARWGVRQGCVGVLRELVREGSMYGELPSFSMQN